MTNIKNFLSFAKDIGLVMETHEKFLKSTSFIDFDHPSIEAFTQQTIAGSRTREEKAIKLFYAIRDGWHYLATRISFREEDMKASSILKKTEGHCIEKAILMIACCRQIGIPARLCLAKVKNHIAAEHVEKLFGTDELVPHGYAEVFLNQRWVKATPTFNQSLCEKLNVQPLEFDGRQDCLFQEYDQGAGAFMEYLDDYGHFEDVPLDFIINIMQQHYPILTTLGYAFQRGATIDLT